MSNHLAQKLCTLLAAALPLGFSVACSTDDSKPKVERVGLKSIDVREAAVDATATPSGGDDGTTDGATDSTDGGDTNPDATDSVSLFKRTTYPLLTKWCASCHAAQQSPIFSNPDPIKAHEAIITGEKVDFQDPARSRLVLRESVDRHNCPVEGCDVAAKALQDAITDWASHLEDQNVELPKQAVTGLKLFGDAAKKTISTTIPPGIITVEAEKGTLKAPFALAAVAGASGNNVVLTPAGAGTQNNVTTAATQLTLGTLGFDVNIVEDGTYRLFGLVNAPTLNNNSFWVKMDAGTLLGWQFPASVPATAYAWDLADAVVAAGTPLTFALTAGAHHLEIRQREEQTKIDKIVLTNDPMFDPATAVPPTRDVNVLSYDVAKETGVAGALLTVEVSDYSANAYMFKNPTLVLPTGKVKVKNMKLLINGVFLPQHATYTIVDKTVAAPGGVLSSAALVALKDKGLGLDEFSFAFETLEAAP